jgi:hypothetical protein
MVMSGFRLLAGQVLSVVAVILALLNVISGAPAFGLSTMVVDISGFLFALSAFVITLEKGSVLISVLLMLHGVMHFYSSYSTSTTLGIYFGTVILVLGVVKLGLTYRIQSKVAGTTRNSP